MSSNYKSPSKKQKERDTLVRKDGSLNYSAKDYVPPWEDDRFNHGKMKGVNVDRDDVEFSVDDDGNIDWQDYYKKMTPQIEGEELEEIKKEKKVSPFSPDYNDDAFIKDDKLHNEINEEGELEYVETPEEVDDIDRDYDLDLVFEDDEEEDENEEETIDDYIYSKSVPSDGDAFLVILEEDGEIFDNIYFVEEIKEKEIHFKDEDENDLILYLDEENNIILKSDDYKYDILEFEKIQEIEPKDLEDDKLFLTKDVYDDIELDVEELKEKKYSLIERKESLITELISLFNAQKSKQKIIDICDISENYITMLEENSENDFVYDNKLPFLKNVKNNKFTFPKWIVPIATNVKKLYSGDEDVTGDFEDISRINFVDELTSKIELLETNTEYQSMASTLFKTKPFYNKESGVVLEHDGHYIRDCNNNNPCHGIGGEYIFEMNKTRKNYRIPLINKGETYYKTIVGNETLSISGLYLIPHNNYNLTFQHTKSLPLLYSSKLSNDKYSYITNNRIFNYESIAPHILGPNTSKTDLYPKTINSYAFDEFVTKENINKTLGNLPTIRNIIDNIPERVISKIFNYNDLRLILLPYSIEYKLLDNESKEKINKIIEKNTKNFIEKYGKKVKKKIIKKKTKNKRILSTDEKIELSWTFIQSIMNIPIKNNYIKQFIDVFSREPFDGEDQRYLYTKNSPTKLLCKHYLYSSRIDDDEDAHLSLRRLFGGIPKDGIVSCNCCGEFLCPEDFSLLEGFADGTPKNTKEVLKNDKETLKELSEKQISILKKIKTISSLLSLELNEFDKNTIIDFFDTVNDEELVDIRYKNTNTIKKHPTFKEISKKYKPIKPKNDKDKELNKNNKRKLEREKETFKRYLFDGNEFLIITYLILFHLQVSSPPYDVKTKDIFNLWNKKDIYENDWALINRDIHSRISVKTINSMFSLIEKACKKYGKDPFWNNVAVLLNENNKYKSLAKAKTQFITTGYYILKNEKIRKKLKEYYQNQNDIHTSVYLRESWTAFKPSEENPIVVDIHKKVNERFKNLDLALKEKGEITYENISSIRSFDTAYTKPRREELNIPYSDIMKNEAYKRLLEFCIHLHGVENERENINLTINNFIETIQYKDEIENKLVQIGWNKSEKRLKKIEYSNLRRTLFEIQKIFIEKDPKEEKTIELYNYIKINNWNGKLLNGNPKRFYSYKNPVVLPFKTYDELKEIYDNYKKEGENETGLNVIEALFKKYCFDSEGNINLKMSHDEFILNIVANPDFIEREVLCQDNITVNKENFEKIMEFKVSSKRLPLQNITNIDTEFLIESRLFDFIDKNNFLKYPGEYSYSLMKELYSLKGILDAKKLEKPEIESLYRSSFSKVEATKSKYIENIKRFLEKSIEDSILPKEQLAYYKKNRGKIENIDIFINDFLILNEENEKTIDNIFHILGRLSNNRNKFYRGTVLSSDIPKHWKLTETNAKNLETFIDEKEFLLHNEVFIESKKYEGFYKYLEDEKYSYCFKGLLEYMKETYSGGIHDIKGDDNTYYNTIYSSMFRRYLIVYTLDRIIQYIESLYDEQSLPSRRAHELFLILEERDQIELKDSIEKCSEFFFDILMDILDENNDTNWIYNKDIADKLSRQKETEKQDLINDLEGQTSEKRTSTVEMQNAGIINWFKDFSSKNLERIKEDKYESNIEEERLNKVKELLLEKQTELEVSQQFGVNVDGLLEHVVGDEMNPIEEEGYDQFDGDREEEGDDDEDHDGDYREN